MSRIPESAEWICAAVDKLSYPAALSRGSRRIASRTSSRIGMALSWSVVTQFVSIGGESGVSGDVNSE